MKKKVFWSVFLVSVITMILTCGIVIGTVHTNSTNILISEVKAEAIFVSEALNTFDNSDRADEYIAHIGKRTSNRITVVSDDGTVLYDSFAHPESMSNHLSRPEVQAAFAEGSGEDIRFSDTLGEKNYYYAVKLDDGSVLRIANTTKSALGILGNAAGLAAALFLFIGIVGVIIAITLSRSFLKPINNLNLDEPLSNETYEELSPLLNKLERKNQEVKKRIEELSNKQREFDHITSSMSEGLVIFSEDGKLLSANDSAMRIFGKEDAVSYLTLCRDADYIKAVEQALKGTSSVEKINMRGKNYQITASAVTGDGNKYGAVLFVTDITEREQSEKLRREFSANVSHELKTPLTSIMGRAELIQNGFVKHEDISQFAGQIHAEAVRLLDLIEDIIRLSQLDEENMKQEFKPVDLFSLCTSVADKLKEKAVAKGVTLEFEGETAVINGVEPVLHEMVYNLCDNAITYNREGGSVKIALKKASEETFLTVADTGIGIPHEHQNRVFERFFRVDKSHSKETGGTGLGLSIVKHGAMLHHGELSLKSEPGRGTEITIVFKSPSLL